MQTELLGIEASAHLARRKGGHKKGHKCFDSKVEHDHVVDSDPGMSQHAKHSSQKANLSVALDFQAQ